LIFPDILILIKFILGYEYISIAMSGRFYKRLKEQPAATLYLAFKKHIDKALWTVHRAYKQNVLTPQEFSEICHFLSEANKRFAEAVRAGGHGGL